MHLLKLNNQAGISLLESLVAMAILAVAVLGMLGAQLRTLTETQSSVRRAQAVRLIEDFAERVKSHPDGFRLEAASAPGWDAMPEAPNCRSVACNPEALAQWDLATWKRTLADTLPSGQGQVFDSGNPTLAGQKKLLGVMVAWRQAARAPGDAAYEKPFAIEAPANAAPCPAQLICHLAYVQP